MASLRTQVEAEIERVYANKETKERASLLSRKPLEQNQKKGGSSIQLNEDLMDFGDLGTIQMCDEIEPPRFQLKQMAIEEEEDFDFVEVEDSDDHNDDHESEISFREDLSGDSQNDGANDFEF